MPRAVSESRRFLGCLRVQRPQTFSGLRCDRHAYVGEGEIGLAGLTHFANDPRTQQQAAHIETPKTRAGGKVDRGRDGPGQLRRPMRSTVR